MNCPVEMVDYQSSLIAADWYEEYGQQLIAEQIRIISEGQFPNGWMFIINFPQRRYCVSNNESVRSNYHSSISRSKNDNRHWPNWSTSRAKESKKLSHCSSRKHDTFRWLNSIASP